MCLELSLVSLFFIFLGELIVRTCFIEVGCPQQLEKVSNIQNAFVFTSVAILRASIYDLLDTITSWVGEKCFFKYLLILRMIRF